MVKVFTFGWQRGVLFKFPSFRRTKRSADTLASPWAGWVSAPWDFDESFQT